MFFFWSFVIVPFLYLWGTFSLLGLCVQVLFYNFILSFNRSPLVFLWLFVGFCLVFLCSSSLVPSFVVLFLGVLLGFGPVFRSIFIFFVCIFTSLFLVCFSSLSFLLVVTCSIVPRLRFSVFVDVFYFCFCYYILLFWYSIGTFLSPSIYLEHLVCFIVTLYLTFVPFLFGLCRPTNR